MTLTLKKITTAILSLGMIGGVLLSVGIDDFRQDVNLRAETTEATRRIYVWVEDAMDKDGWGDGQIYIHYWGGTGSVWETRPQMNTILAAGSFYRGLFYYDIPSNNNTFMITAESGEPNEWQKSDEVTLASGNRFKSFKLINVYTGGSHDGRPNFYESSVAISANQFISVVNKVDSCSIDFASGWNHYKDLIRIFLYDDDSFTTRIMGESEFNLLDTTMFNDMAYYASFSLTDNRTLNISIQEKIESLRLKYNADHSTSFPALTIS